MKPSLPERRCLRVLSAGALPVSSAGLLYKVPFVTAAVGEPVPLPFPRPTQVCQLAELPLGTGQTGEMMP